MSIGFLLLRNALDTPPAEAHHLAISRRGLADLVAKSDLILRGRVTQQQSQWNQAGSEVETRSIIETLYIVAGNAPMPLEIYTEGGRIPGQNIAVAYSETAQLYKGEEVLLFVQKIESRYQIVGGEIGKFVINDLGTIHPFYPDGINLELLYAQTEAYLLEGQQSVLLPEKWQDIELAYAEYVPGLNFIYQNSKWGVPEVKYKININTDQAGGENGSVQNFTQAIINAGNSWSRVGSSDFTLKFDGMTDVTETGLNGVNEIVFEHQSRDNPLAKARVWYDIESQIIQEADIWINDDYSWDATGAPSLDEADLESTLLHELGHWLALGHDSEQAAVMYFQLTGGVVKRGLHDNDREGILYIYPCEIPPCIPAGLPPEPTSTGTPTPSSTPTVTPTPTLTATPTATYTPSPTPTSTFSPTSTSTPTSTPTSTSTPSSTPTFSPTATTTSTATPLPTTTPSPTATPLPTPAPTPTEQLRTVEDDPLLPEQGKQSEAIYLPLIFR